MNNARREERFWLKVVPDGDCLIFTGKADTGNGYGKVYDVLAHRYAYSLKHTLDPDLDVLHTCDNRRCVKDEHLYQGTNTDNIRDKVQRGRAAKGGMHNAGFHFSQRTFSDEEATEVKARIAAHDYESLRALAREYGVSHTTMQTMNRYYREIKTT